MINVILMVRKINIHKGLYRPIGQLVTQSSSKFSH